MFLKYLPPVNQLYPIGSQPKEQPSYPAQLLYCPKCHLVQLGLVVDPQVIFPKEYPYTSGTTKILRDNNYKIEREKGWVLYNLVISVLEGENITTVSKEELAEKIMKECINFINDELIDKVKQLEVENCYMVTHGVKEYQLEKVHRTGLGALFTEIFVVQDTKKGPVEMICKKFKDDEVVFVDDKEKRFADLDFEKYPNLRKVLYVGPESIDEVFQ